MFSNADYAVKFEDSTGNKDNTKAMAWWGKGQYDGKDDPDAPYYFEYNFNNARIEELQKSGFYGEPDSVVDPDDKTKKSKYSAVKIYIMHTIWLIMKQDAKDA